MGQANASADTAEALLESYLGSPFAWFEALVSLP